MCLYENERELPHPLPTLIKNDEATYIYIPSVKQHERKNVPFRDQELCESRGGRPGLPVPNSPYGLCGRKATLTNVPFTRTTLTRLQGSQRGNRDT